MYTKVWIGDMDKNKLISSFLYLWVTLKVLLTRFKNIWLIFYLFLKFGDFRLLISLFTKKWRSKIKNMDHMVLCILKCLILTIFKFFCKKNGELYAFTWEPKNEKKCLFSFLPLNENIQHVNRMTFGFYVQ